MNKLDEIIEQTTFNRGDSLEDFAKKVAFKFAKHILEEAVGNAKIGIYSPDNRLYNTKRTITCDNSAFYRVDEKSIKEVMNKHIFSYILNSTK